MTAEATSSVLRQMTQAHQPASPDVPLTASRAVRLATTRAADNAAGLSLTVLDVSEESMGLDDLLAALSDDLLMVSLLRRGKICGLMTCDFQFSAAAVEVRTMGILAPSAPEQRPVTGTDLKLSEPILQRVLSELALTTPRTVLDSWADDAVIGPRFDLVRKVGFDLSDMAYRLVRIKVDLDGEGREGNLMIALPLLVQIEQPTGEKVLDWQTYFQAAVLKSPARLDAVLHRFQMPLHLAANLDIDQVIPLPGCTVGSVVIESPDGHEIARGRLGQIAGKIAVRLEGEDPAPPMIEMPDMGGGLLGDASAGMPAADPMDALAGGGLMGGADPMAEIGGANPTGDLGGGLMAGADPIGDMPAPLEGPDLMSQPMGGMMLDQEEDGGLPDLGQPMSFDPDLALGGDED